MKTLIDDPTRPPDTESLVSLLTHTPGRWGEWVLGAHTTETGIFFGWEDAPEEPDHWSDWGRVGINAGVITSFQYALQHRSASWDATLVDKQFNAACESLQAILGKPTRQTKKLRKFSWDQGHVEVERTSMGDEVFGVSFLTSGHQPFVSAEPPSST